MRELAGRAEVQQLQEESTASTGWTEKQVQGMQLLLDGSHMVMV